MADLKPCPFCGGEPYATRTVNGTQEYRVGCAPCGVAFKAAWYRDADAPTKDIAAAWNRRAPEIIISAAAEALCDAYEQIITTPPSEGHKPCRDEEWCLRPRRWINLQTGNQGLDDNPCQCHEDPRNGEERRKREGEWVGEEVLRDDNHDGGPRWRREERTGHDRRKSPACGTLFYTGHWEWDSGDVWREQFSCKLPTGHEGECGVSESQRGRFKDKRGER